MNNVFKWLAHPLTKDLDLDDPATTELRRTIIKSKPFLTYIYVEWYQKLLSQVPSTQSPVLELGAGAGFLSEVFPGVIRSDILVTRYIDLVCDGQKLPFPSHSLGSILMTNVLHHIPDPKTFFHEAHRCLQTGGVIVMIEPWNTTWSKFVYEKIHHEVFDPTSSQWNIEPGKPLSAANGAIPWMLFARDRSVFEKNFPYLKTERIELIMPFAYLLSGGISTKNIMPGWMYKPCRVFENWLQPIFQSIAMFALITIRKIG